MVGKVWRDKGISVFFPQKDDPAKNNPRFWDELFLMKVRTRP